MCFCCSLLYSLSEKKSMNRWVNMKCCRFYFRHVQVESTNTFFKPVIYLRKSSVYELQTSRTLLNRFKTDGRNKFLMWVLTNSLRFPLTSQIPKGYRDNFNLASFWVNTFGHLSRCHKKINRCKFYILFMQIIEHLRCVTS